LAVTILAGWASVSAEEAKCDAGMPTMEMGAPIELKTVYWELGDWKVHVKERMDPSQPWNESEGTAKLTLVLDSCAIRSDYTGVLMGMPIKGMGLLTYNKGSKRYQSYWIDNMAGYPSFYDCKLDSAGNLICEGEDNMMGTMIRSKTVSKKLSPSSWMFEYYMSMDGKEWIKSMEMTHSK